MLAAGKERFLSLPGMQTEVWCYTGVPQSQLMDLQVVMRDNTVSACLNLQY